jgi:hypothetical protein
MINDVFAVQISEGGLHWLMNRLASKGADAYEMIWQRVLHSQVIGTDETGVKINGKKSLVLDMAKQSCYIYCPFYQQGNNYDY